MGNKDKGLSHARKAMSATLDGLSECFRREAAFRHECLVGILNLVLALTIPRTWTETGVILVVYLTLPMVELLNSAVEETVDMVTKDWDERAKRAKDYGSAAVFIAIALVCASWAVVLFRRFALP